jgi:hypothetical protein
MMQFRDCFDTFEYFARHTALAATVLFTPAGSFAATRHRRSLLSRHQPPARARSHKLPNAFPASEFSDNNNTK